MSTNRTKVTVHLRGANTPVEFEGVFDWSLEEGGMIRFDDSEAGNSYAFNWSDVIYFMETEV
jgi:hypothetical protein